MVWLRQTIHEVMTDPFVLVVPIMVLLATLAAGWIVRRLLFKVLREWSAHTESHLGDLVIQTLRGPIFLWSLILGLHLATQSSEIPKQYLHYVPMVLASLWILSLTIATSQFAGNAIHYYSLRGSNMQTVTSLTQKLAQLAIVCIGAVVLMKEVFDLSLTPILTTLGVGGLAVALALQDTLSNLFAGFYVSISGLVRIGDYIKMNSGEEGYITDINWRCTTLRGTTNNMVVVPNNKLGQATFTNYHLPEPRMILAIPISVAYDSDIDRVEQILLEETLAATATIPGLLADPKPYIRFTPGLGDYALVFQVTFSIGEYPSQYAVISELRKLLYKRLVREKITLPYPTQTVHLQTTGPPTA